MKNNLFEILISLVLIGVLVIFANPMVFTMPTEMHVVMGPSLIFLLILFTGIFWKEQKGDERETLHKYIAGRFAYFAGITVLVLAIVLQSLHNVLDSWLVIALAIMLLAKIVGLLYGNYRR
jgi:hypothetical protein